MKRFAHSIILGAIGALLVVGTSAPVRAADKGSSLLDAQQLSRSSGAVIYHHVCQACHMPDARGATGAGTFPALAGDKHLASSRFMITMIVMGRSDMPSFSPLPGLKGFQAKNHVTLSDAEVARVVNYVRSHFGNHYSDRVTPADVAALRPAKESKP